VRKALEQKLPERAINTHTILNGDNTMIVMMENGMRPYASGTGIKAPIIIPSETLRRFVVLTVVLVEMFFLKPGLVIKYTFGIPIS
jgi:hypothetical protein